MTPEILPFVNMAGFRCLCCRRVIGEGVLWRVEGPDPAGEMSGVGAYLLCLDCSRRVGEAADRALTPEAR